MSAHPRRLLYGVAACAGAGTLWGMGFFFGKFALREMSVGHMVLYRFLFACIAMAPICFRHRPHFTRHEWGLLLVASFFGVPLQFLLQFRGLSLTTVSHASLMVGALPVMLAVAAAIFARERVDLIGWLALIGSTFGAILIAMGAHHAPTGEGPSLAGDMLVLLSLAVALTWILLNKHLMQKHNAIVVTAWGLLAGTAMLLPWVLLRNGLPPVTHVSLRAWGALAASGLLCTAVTTMLWNFGLTQIPASMAGVFLNLEPLTGSLLGVLVLGEHLGPDAWLGGALIMIAAITLTARPHSHTEAQPLPL
ncbi:MAG: EamA family transporter [Acidobacteriaceae bacterium]|nr:EamA family transporter [Acidobacteriaceae bacterium]